MNQVDTSPFEKINNSQVLSCIFFELSYKQVFGVCTRVCKTWRAIIASERFQKPLIKRCLEHNQQIQAYHLMISSPLGIRLQHDNEVFFNEYNQIKNKKNLLLALSRFHYLVAMKTDDAQSVIKNLFSIYKEIILSKDKSELQSILNHHSHLVIFKPYRMPEYNYALLFILNLLYIKSDRKLKIIMQSKIIQKLKDQYDQKIPFCKIKTPGILELLLFSLSHEIPSNIASILPAITNLKKENNEYLNLICEKLEQHIAFWQIKRNQKKQLIRKLAGGITLLATGIVFAWNWNNSQSNEKKPN